ncbi:MAG TPA: Mur ligase family protein [Candidatus Krumholzibacteria bacterium]|nr:Mur ligase family protein [Candidatus Krumholzibacteria bacterium]
MARSLRPFPDLSPDLPPNLKFVLGLSPSAMTLGLGNISAMLDRLGHPERAFRSVLIAGTNGKGSTTTMLASIVAHEGLRTGRYISPHVFHVAERISVDGDFASIDELEAAAAKISSLRDDIQYSYFEALTAIAFLIFAERGVEVAALEVGLGGRFDATNIVSPTASIITSISLDHRRILGDTEEAILGEKLGITRPGVPLFVGDLKPHLMDLVRERGKRDGFPVLELKDIGDARILSESLGGLEVDLKTTRADYGRIRVPFPGSHQAANCLLATCAGEVLVPTLSHVRAGIEEAFIAGRFQVIEKGGRTFILDIAHNEEALRATAAHLAEFAPREDVLLIFGLLRRKELFDAPVHLLKAAGALCLVEPESEPGSTDTAFAPHELLQHFFLRHLPDASTDVILWNRRDERDDSLARLAERLERAGDHHRVVVAVGSHRIVQDFGRRIWHP